MKLFFFPILAAVFAASPLLADSIDWPKNSFTVEKLKEAQELAAKEQKPIAYIIMERGKEVDRKDRKKDDNGNSSAAAELTEDLAKDCARFAIVVNVVPDDLQKDPNPFTEKVYGAFAGALASGTIPALVIADAAGAKIFAYCGSQELIDESSKVLRDTKRNIKEGKEAEYKQDKKDEKD